MADLDVVNRRIAVLQLRRNAIDKELAELNTTVAVLNRLREDGFDCPYEGLSVPEIAVQLMRDLDPERRGMTTKLLLFYAKRKKLDVNYDTLRRCVTKYPDRFVRTNPDRLPPKFVISEKYTQGTDCES